MGDRDEARSDGTPATRAITDRVRSLLREMAATDARESRLIVRADAVWLVVIREADRETWRVEAPASHRLPAPLRLSQERAQALRELGYMKHHGGRSDFVRVLDARDALDPTYRLAEHLVDVLSDTYATEPDERLGLSLLHDDRVHPNNPELLDAMVLVSKRKDPESRMVLYNAMANATFLLPLADEQEAEVRGWRVAEQQHDRPTFDLYTDWLNFRLAHPLDHEYEPVHGSDLFERAHGLHALTLNFNPHGPVGGQLYAPEIANMVTAIRRWCDQTSH